MLGAKEGDGKHETAFRAGGAFKNAPIRKKLILSTWLVAIVPIVVIFAVVFFVFVNTGAESARRQALP